jgi:hypothetical protein
MTTNLSTKLDGSKFFEVEGSTKKKRGRPRNVVEPVKPEPESRASAGGPQRSRVTERPLRGPFSFEGLFMADVFKTRDQLIYRALKNLGQIEPGEAPAAEDYAAVDDLVDPLIATLAANDIYYVANPDEIDNEVYLPLARLLANVAGPDFGSAINEDAKLDR